MEPSAMHNHLSPAGELLCSCAAPWKRPGRRARLPRLPPDAVIGHHG